MKAFIRKTVRGLAHLPVVGRLVRIGVAVIRLPEFRDSLQHALSMQRTLPPAVDVSGQQLFQSEQLPTLLQALSDVNHRQLIEANGHANLVRSVPVALRKLTRDMVQLRQQQAELQAALARQGEQAATAADQAAALANQAAALTDSHATSIGQAQQALDRQAAELAAVSTHSRQLAESVSYLLGRVEFVRRELMFEMRYGAGNGGAGEQLQAQGEILAADKVAAARATGARLNLGCGHVPLDGYLNVDRRALPGVDIVAEVDQLPFAEGELAEICSAHLLEHFPLEQLRRELLPYWAGLLRQGGRFRAIVPDGAGTARAFANDEYSFESLRQVTFGGQDYDGDFHYNMFSVESLSALLREAGFDQVEVIAENRENGGCKEFELVAVKA